MTSRVSLPPPLGGLVDGVSDLNWPLYPSFGWYDRQCKWPKRCPPGPLSDILDPLGGGVSTGFQPTRRWGMSLQLGPLEGLKWLPKWQSDPASWRVRAAKMAGRVRKELGKRPIIPPGSVVRFDPSSRGCRLGGSSDWYVRNQTSVSISERTDFNERSCYLINSRLKF